MLKTMIAALALVALVGCAPTPAVPVASLATPTATPSATAAVSDARPPQVFGGSCDSFVTTDEISELYGSPLLTAVRPATMTAAFLVDQVGGLRCHWTDEEGPSQSVWISAAIVPLPAVAAAEAFECYEDYGCFGDATAGGMRLSFSAEGQEADSEFAEALVAMFRERAVEPAPVAASPVPGTWLTLTDCSVLSSAIDVGAFFGEPDEWVQEHQGRGYEGTPSAIVEMWAVPINTCDWSNYHAEPVWGFRIDTLGGGAWVYDEFVANPDMTELRVAGFEHTLVEVTEYGFQAIHFFDGTNWMRTEVMINGEWETDPALIGRIARAAADVLDLTAAP